MQLWKKRRHSISRKCRNAERNSAHMIVLGYRRKTPEDDAVKEIEQSKKQA